MPPEPDHKMDDLLKAYAKKRRTEAGAPAQLHPATRRLLQGEVARLRPDRRQASTSWREALGHFWPRVAIVAGIVVIAGLAVALFLPPAGRNAGFVQMAKQDAAAPPADSYAAGEKAARSRADLSPATTAPSRPMAEPAIASDDNAKSAVPIRREAGAMTDRAAIAERDSEGTEKKLKSVELAASPVPTSTSTDQAGGALRVDAPALAPPPGEPMPKVAQLADAKDKGARGVSGPAQAAPTSTAAALGSVTIADARALDALELRKSEKSSAQAASPMSQTAFFSKANADPQPQANNGNVQRRFAIPQTDSPPGQNRPAPGYSDASVLANFVLEQNGDRLRVVDEDGSIYEGKVLNGEISPTNEKEALAAGQAGGSPGELKVGLALAGQEVRQQQQEARPALGSQTANGSGASTWNFRLTGTNRTLKQAVTVDGVLYETAATNAISQAEVIAANALTRTQSALPAQSSLQQNLQGVTVAPAPNSFRYTANPSYGVQSLNLSNALRIQGSYRVGTTTPLPLDAVRDLKQP